MAILDLSAIALRLTTIKTQDKALFYEHISNLVEGGVTILEALSSFSDKTDNLRLKQEVLTITEFVRSGDRSRRPSRNFLVHLIVEKLLLLRQVNSPELSKDLLSLLLSNFVKCRILRTRLRVQ